MNVTKIYEDWNLHLAWGPPAPEKVTTAYPSRHLKHNPALVLKSIRS